MLTIATQYWLFYLVVVVAVVLGIAAGVVGLINYHDLDATDQDGYHRALFISLLVVLGVAVLGLFVMRPGRVRRKFETRSYGVPATGRS